MRVGVVREMPPSLINDDVYLERLFEIEDKPSYHYGEYSGETGQITRYKPLKGELL